ncbi:MAG: FGGY family carbohydrate kinase, partial [Alishewanella sp.]|nr:FGGY family carbohydrate kinase [Alishewanella sp.]
MAEYLLAIDQGTTSSRAVLFNLQGQPQASVSETFEQHFPDNGWVEHHPEDLWSSVLRCCQQVLAKQQITAAQVKALGITNQRETTLVWHKSTGKTLYPAIVWQDRRTSGYCEQLLTPQLADTISNKTGLLLDPYFSASKIRWILDNVPGAQQQAARGELAFGTVDSFLLWQLTAGKVHRTDATNASRTLLFNIHNQQWDPELLEVFDIPASMLPEVMDSAAYFGETEAALFGQPIVIGGMAGDQQAALIGQACFEPGMAKSTYGTGCFLMLNTGEKPLKSANKLLTTNAYRLEGNVTYA